MTTLTINDLTINADMDQAAMNSIAGGHSNKVVIKKFIKVVKNTAKGRVVKFKKVVIVRIKNAHH